MKVILVQDVPKLGDAGTVQEVAPGYARNFLIPRGLATAATKGSIKQVEERQAAEAKRVAKQELELRGLADRIQGMRLEMEARVGEQGRLYGSITAGDIAERLTSMLGEEIDRRKIDLEDPIRTVGEHNVTIRLVGRLQPTVTVVVSDPEAEAAAASAAADTATSGEAETATASDDSGSTTTPADLEMIAGDTSDADAPDEDETE